jgi:23S rRNA pseudouridine1911/1915/1917 synthase
VSIAIEHWQSSIQQMAWEHKTHVVTAEQVGRVDLVLKTITGRSRSQLRGMCLNGCVQINGREVTEPSTAVKEGDVIDVRFDPQRKYRETWLGKLSHKSPRGLFRCKTFRVVFEDDYLIVVDKQAGILTVPTERQEPRTLVDEVSRYLGGRNRALVVHRLDRETSGLLVFAKRSEIAGALQDQLRLRAPEREYLALVAGIMTADAGQFESYLATSKRLSRYSVNNPDGGEHAITHFAVKARFPEATLVSIKLDTGRRNQIRVHLSEAGHPVIGDRRYRPQLASHLDWPYARLALHAHVLGFQHPVTGENLRFVSEMPRTFHAFIKQQRRIARQTDE